jgi:hypothetical protein
MGDETEADPPIQGIVSAAATMVAVGGMGAAPPSDPVLIAMMAAQDQAYAEGISDPDEIKARKMAARAAALAKMAEG